ncbi:hypothetical protein KDA_73890 [Dictyobacter alpinus]|uniref:Uncharacterized protein n=1 Tax=Dictyobacter alpinus TaxID=2014873 RepID=A0A402BKM2_9CHLR|nr:hypothetical protein [Dictyobacter alpinus]GCE31905.1 hypothetical protein KDA_73890 [Dictyobacter alpinus]
MKLNHINLAVTDMSKAWFMFGHRVGRDLRDKQLLGEDTGPPSRGGNRPLRAKPMRIAVLAAWFAQ